MAEFAGVKITGEDPELTFTNVPEGAAGEPVLKDGVISWDTAGLAPGEYTFTGVVVDAYGQETRVTFTVTVYPALTAVDQEALVGTLPKTATHTFTEKVSGGDGNTKAVIIEKPERGSVKLGSVVYTSHEGGGVYAPKGVYTTVVTYTDGVGQTATGRYVVTVQPAPTGQGEKTTLRHDDQAAVFDPIGNTVGTNLQPVTMDSIVALPEHGTVSVSGAMVSYTPKNGFTGTDRFTVRVCDDLGQCVDLNYEVTVLGAGDPEPGTTDGSSANLATTGGSGLGTPIAVALIAAIAGVLLFGGVLLQKRRRRREV
ncbi:hypothetical protein G7066_12060 [Leucobacter coleopterorum]|uniref:LPXTG-motif cell wall anchor domain-containing protein n=1 Tax=Leucobacter coleopterorum TaxID=2714933 RepID=A0ABX6JXR7_9MICO|nr:Ig-like domain-containing protein [Leucobacter coleopterorum]QIM19116.1 hypothetical protein G7066_12060 [Leucobacter coleopterorum]